MATSIHMILAAVLVALLSRGEGPASCDRDCILEGYRRLHSMRWSSMTPADVNRVTAWNVREVPQADGDGASVYYERNETSWKLLLRFDGNPKPHLASVTYRWNAEDAGLAEKLRAAVIYALKPGGLPVIDTDSFTFKWRSLDSRTLFDLALRLTKEGTSTRLYATLRHTAVEPKSVDYLPFEKGFMGCADESHKKP